jgi:hypothetical protein
MQGFLLPKPVQSSATAMVSKGRRFESGGGSLGSPPNAPFWTPLRELRRLAQGGRTRLDTAKVAYWLRAPGSRRPAFGGPSLAECEVFEVSSLGRRDDRFAAGIGITCAVARRRLLRPDLDVIALEHAPGVSAVLTADVRNARRLAASSDRESGGRV